MHSEDELSWHNFKQNSNLSLKDIPGEKEIKKFNRLLMHSKNFFVIAAYGNFTEGYVMIIPKELISSFASMSEILVPEFLWLKDFVKNLISNIYNGYNTLVFEHGLCACLGGLDRAHLHVMPYKRKNEYNIIQAIDASLVRRNIGNQKVKLGNHLLTNPDDISLIISNKKKSDILEITGKKFTYKDIKSNFLASEYPANIKNENVNGKPYIYFDTNNENTSFITFVDISTQFGREIAFCIDYSEANDLEIFTKNNNVSYNDDKFYWKWQDYNFDKNISNTMKKVATYITANPFIEKDIYDFTSFI